MCLPTAKMPKDNSADIARAAEDERQGRITQGQQGIDTAFAGFDQPFYDKYNTDYTSYYAPQLDDQYGEAAKRLTLQLAQTGNLAGSTGAEQQAKLKKYYDAQKLAVTTQGMDATKQLRGNIDSRKSQLYADNRSAADPGQAAAAAAGAAQQLVPGQPASPLANVFGDFFSNLGNVAALQNARKYGNTGGVQSFAGTGGGNQSVRVV